MPSVKSPYREAGVPSPMTKDKRREPKIVRGSRATVWGHKFTGLPVVLTKVVGKRVYKDKTGSEACNRCGKPRFAVESMPCRGR